MDKFSKIATRIAFSQSATDKKNYTHDKVVVDMLEWTKTHKMPRKGDYEDDSEYERDIRKWTEDQAKKLSEYGLTREAYLSGFKKNLQSLKQVLDADAWRMLNLQLATSSSVKYPKLAIISNSLLHAGLTPWEAQRIASSFYH